jgi:hypothetical protein
MFKIGDFIKPNDEEYVYQIDDFFRTKDGEIESYNGKSIGYGHGRGFSINATHYRRATQEEIDNELNTAPKYFAFWIANKKNVLVANGQIFAPTLERAKEIFNGKLIHTNNVGDYFMSDKPTKFIKD